MRFRFRRKNTTRTTGSMYWANEDGGLAEARRINFPITGSEDWQDIELNLSSHAHWYGKTGIFAIRLDLENNTDTTAIIDIAYIALGRRAAAASAQALDALTSRVTLAEGTLTSTAARTTNLESTINNTSNGLATKASATALNNLQTTVTSQGSSISAQAQQINQLNSTVGANSAQITQLNSTVADNSGKISAAYSVRLNLAQNGLQYVAGFGVSLDNNAGVVQSQFVVAADRFAVIRDVAGNVSSPFIIENGQVFIADAVIKKATIANALIGQGVYSSTFTNYGQPVMSLDFNSGQITIQNKATNGKYMILREDGLFAVSGGVVMLELSL